MVCHGRYSWFLSERATGENNRHDCLVMSSCIQAYPVDLRQRLQISDELIPHCGEWWSSGPLPVLRTTLPSWGRVSSVLRAARCHSVCWGRGLLPTLATKSV